jgi:ribosomal protein L31
MNVRGLIFCFAVLLAVPVFARDKTDVIVMKNGDHLTGQVKGLDGGVLYVSMDYILGTSSVQWSKVDHLESKQLFLVKTEDGSVYSGTLSTAESTGGRPVQIEVVESPEHKVTIDRAKIVEMDETSDKFWQRFNGSVNSGITYSKGNQATQYNLSSDVEYPRERWSAGANFNSNLSASTGATVSTRNSLGLNYLRLLRWNNWFYAGLGNFLQSSEQNIRIQTNLGAGVGRYLKNTNRATVSLLGGVAWQNTNYDQTAMPQPSQNVAAAMVGANAKFFRFNKTNLDITALVFPALSQPGRVYFTTNATYYVKIFSNLTWNISFYGNWDNQPPDHFSGSDYGTSSGLGWTFGNK